MRILVLGGTQMLGRDFVERYMAGHSIVLANRGVTLPGLFPDLEHVVVDRDVLAAGDSYGAVGCRALGFLGPVDGVVDFSCYSPAQLENTVPFLPKYGRYVFISTMCVYGNTPSNPLYEYCERKLKCEQWIRDRELAWAIVRPAAVVGDHDYTRRFERRGGKYFWRESGVEAAAGTVPVGDVSRAIMDCLVAPGPMLVNLCR
jgi:2'-hydroxyisoflavone reductase